ncbi:MAG TPA: hypothetical protein VG826_14715 [Pirellulales bacterium]|nr:hypothetical protein [Pirellulales bacterium]
MRKVMALAVLLALVAAPRGFGQEELPAPRRGTPERRVQRGERLRKLADPAGPLGQLLGSLNGDKNTPALDVVKLNDGIVALLQPLLDEEGGLEYLRLRLDPNDTNLARDMVHLVGAARLKRSAWSDEPTQVDLDLRGSVQRRPDGRPLGVLDGELRFQTDVVSLANRAMARFADRLERRAQQGSVRDGPLSAEETFRLRMREKLASTPTLQSMDDVIDLILSFSGLRLTAINDQIAELKAQVESAQDEKARADLTKQLDAARSQRDQMLDLRPQVERDDAGQAVALHLSLDRSQVDAATKIDRLQVVISDRLVSIQLVGNTLQAMELYSIFKPVLLNTLTRIQMRDPDTARLGQSMVRGYIRQFREGLGGPDEERPQPMPPESTP